MGSAVVSANLRYAVRPPSGQELFYYLGGAEKPAGISEHTNYKADPHQADIVDTRSAPQLTIKQNGFALTEFQVSADIDWDDKASVQTHYYPAVQKLLQTQTGANRVHVFDTTLRKGSARSGSAYASHCSPPANSENSTNTNACRREGGVEKNQVKPGSQQTSVNVNVHVDYR